MLLLEERRWKRSWKSSSGKRLSHPCLVRTPFKNTISSLHLFTVNYKILVNTQMIYLYLCLCPFAWLLDYIGAFLLDASRLYKVVSWSGDNSSATKSHVGREDVKCLCRLWAMGFLGKSAWQSRSFSWNYSQEVLLKALSLTVTYMFFRFIKNNMDRN